jgi:anti-sigma factor RsiW
VTNCNDCLALLVDYERGELDAARDAAMFEHLHACPACHAQWQADLAVVESLRALLPEREFPTAVLAGVRQAIHAQREPSILERLRVALRPAIALPVAAAVVIAGGVLGVRHSPPQPTLPGMYFVREHVAQTAGMPSSDRAWSTYLLTSANAGENSDAGSSPNG